MLPNLSEWALQHQPLIRYLMVMLMAAGVWAYSNLGRLEDPDFTLKVMIVQAFWHGATARETALQVTDRIEKKLQETPYLDQLRSYTKPGEGTVFVMLRDDMPASEVKNVWYQVRKKINDLRSELPSDLQGVYFNDEFDDTFGSIFAFTGDNFSFADLKEHAERVRQELLRIEFVGKIQLVALQDEKIYLEFSHHQLATLGLDPLYILNTLQARNSINSAGRVDTASDTLFVRLNSAYNDLETVKNQLISIDGKNFRLGDIAHVYRGYVDPPIFKMHFNGKPAIGLAISMRKGGDIPALGEALQSKMLDIKRNLPLGLELHQVSNQPAVVVSEVRGFVKVLAEAVIIVLAVSFLSLGFRTGLVVALSIPLVLSITFLIMFWLGVDLQRISLGALIIGLGLLVDDAMIAVEMMAIKLEQGWDRVKAATFAYESTAFPMLSGTLVTAAGFIPVGLAKSAAGEYTHSMFVVVIVSLLVSWVVAVLFIPYLGFVLLPTPKHVSNQEHDVYHRGFYIPFRKLVTLCVRFRKTVILITVALFISSVIGFGFVEQQFFPSSSRPELILEMRLPQGASFEATEKEVKKLETLLANDQNIVNYATYIGGGSPRFYLALDVQLFNTNFAQLVIMTKGGEAREAVLQKLRTAFANDFPNVRGRVSRLENGPPVNYPVQFRVTGREIEKTQAIAREVAQIMRKNPHVHDVHLDWQEPAKSIRVIVDDDKAQQLGISAQTLARNLQTYLNGSSLTIYRENDKRIDIIARVKPEERTDLSKLKDINLYLDSKRSIPLEQIARIEPSFEEGIIWRKNRDIMVHARADIADNIQAPDISLQIDPQLKELREKLPAGYRIEIGGAFEESSKSQKPIGQVMPIMLITVITILMLQLKNFSKTILVLLTAPLGLIGMTVALLALQSPFGFVAMLGAISLSGMIMRNSVILVDQIDQDVKTGLPLKEAIIESTVRRFRPIMLTALAAILAMIPLSQNIFWGPMAVAIMGGLMGATLLTLLFLPALYAAWFRVK